MASLYRARRRSALRSAGAGTGRDQARRSPAALYFAARRGGRLQQVHAGPRRRLRCARGAPSLWRGGPVDRDGRRTCDRHRHRQGPDRRRHGRSLLSASFTAPLLARIGIRVPIYPVKGISITFPRGAWNSAPQMPVIDDSKLFGLVPIGDRMRISGSAEIAGYDASPRNIARRSDRRECKSSLSRK